MLLKEIRQAFRLLAKNPGFTAIAAVSLGLGIGANSAIFSLADALLLRPTPVAAPGQLLSLSTVTPSNPSDGMSYPDYLDIRDKSRSFNGVVAYHLMTFGLSASVTTLPQMRMGMVVSDNFFSILGIQPAIGRSFAPEEGKATGRDAVAVLSYDLWDNHFGHDRSLIGRTIRLNGIDFTVIGVAPKAFTGMDPYVRPALFIPLSMEQRLSGSPANPMELRDERSLSVNGRLKFGVSRETAQSELTVIAKSLEKAYPVTNQNRGIIARTEFEARVLDDPPDAYLVAMLMTLAGLVLIIACANVANLLLARARSRSREIAIRLAIGAGRWRLVRQLLIESLALGLMGGVLGLGFAYAGIAFLKTIQIPTDLPIVIGVQLDGRVLLFSLFAAIASALIFGIAPAWQALRTELVPALKSAGLNAVARRRTMGRNALVIGQVALSVVLLAATGVLLEGFRNALVLNPGFRTDHLMSMELNTSFVRYTPEQSRLFYRNLIDRARALHGVRSATLAGSIPLSPNALRQTVIPEGYQFTKGQETVNELSNVVDERYFDTMQVPIVRGRAFNIGDKVDSPPVAIVNEKFASIYWPNQDPIGKRLRLNDRTGPFAEVVGVAKTGRYFFIGEAPTAFLYLPYAQQPKLRMNLVVETYGDPAAIAAPLRDVVRSLDANQPIYNARTLASFYEQRAIAVPRMILQMVATMGLLGLTLALVGLYGLIAYSVSRRTQEIGIRMALGAHRIDVVKMVLLQGFVLSIIGIGIGFVASVGVEQVLAKGLIGLGTPSSATLFVVPLALLGVTMAACYLPARRASQIDPIHALRYE